jgi:nitroimidazol reductase NimA-like FMN-containing flavoprotein (pyridoxamine 5'-phosphate oxidase superfamily)
MVIDEITPQACDAVLASASFGRLGCSLNDQPYVLPIYFVYDAGYLYALSTFGQKIEWMRQNPKVCVETDQFESDTRWTSVVVNGIYQELPEPQFESERAHARKLLEKRPQWWRAALAERQMRLGDNLIEPLYFRIKVESMTGLRASEDGTRQDMPA